jgi:predicted glycogen debranching enzyme
MTAVLRRVAVDGATAWLSEVTHVDPEGPPRAGPMPEWLVTNGLGGYSSGTIPGLITRRFHGVLIAALPAPHGRTMMLNHVSELLRAPDGLIIQIGAQPRPDEASLKPLAARLTEFSLVQGLPVWRYEHEAHVVEKRVQMPYGQNTVQVTYRLLAGDDQLVLELEPWINFRPHEGRLDTPLRGPYSLTACGDRYEVSSGLELPPLRLQMVGAEGSFAIEGKRIHNVRYQIELARGYDAAGDLYSPGFFRAPLRSGQSTSFIASTEDWQVITALTPRETHQKEQERRGRLFAIAHPSAQEGFAAELLLTADQFIASPEGRLQDAARARASGDEIRTVIAGYHWFTDWGRDTMIGLEGLTLVTGRWIEAGYILRSFARSLRDGLVPNMFPEGERTGLYNTADATLWFFHALDRYLQYTSDRMTLKLLLPALVDVIARHLQGTRFGIRVDPDDGLLTQGEEGVALTWMDAKVGDLVVTPRRGKAVEINALYYNALRLLEQWVREEQGPEEARPYAERAERTYTSFNARFWFEEGAYLYDVVDGPSGSDAAFRPNQILSISLKHPALDPARWPRVVDEVRTRLLTPLGLRSLAPGHADFKAKYFGDLRARDLAYHQGTVWAWLIGPFVDAWLKVHPDRSEECRQFLAGFERHLGQSCIGTISEIFDADEPYTPRGCVAQAWSVAEVLRCLVKTSPPASKSDSEPGNVVG